MKKIKVTKKVLNEVGEFVKLKPRTAGEIQRHFNFKFSRTYTEAVIQKLCEHDSSFVYDKTISGLVMYKYSPRTVFRPPEDEFLHKKHVKILLISDIHAGGLQSQLLLLKNHIIPIAQEEKVDVVGIAGDITNGLKHLDYSRGQNIANTGRSQVKIAEEGLLPLIELNVPIYMRSGDHDDWQFTASGYDMVGQLVQNLNYHCLKKRRKELFHLVGFETNYQFEHDGLIVELLHPVKGATKSKSYGPQQYTEARLGEFISFLRGETTRGRSPHVSAYGQFHREIIFYYLDIIHVLIPGLQATTYWEFSKQLVHQVGAWILEVELASRDKKGPFLVSGYGRRYINLDMYVKPRTVEQLEEEWKRIALQQI